MDTAKLWQLHREGRDCALLQWAQGVDPSSVPDEGLCELLGELFSGADQVELAILWYRRANTDAARRALPLLLLRRGDADGAKRLLAAESARGVEWYEANYLLQVTEDPTPGRRLDALQVLLQEQFLEPYMTEYAAVCFQVGQEKRGLHMAKKQLRLFPGGPYERQARDILDRGAPAAQAFLYQLDARRRPRPEHSPAGTPGAPAAVPPGAPEKEPPAPARPLPEPVARCFDGMVGMSRAQQVLLQLYDTVRFQKSRRDHRLDIHSHFHFLIRGADGSGKTLLANRISGFLHELEVAGDPAPCILEWYQLDGYLAGTGSDLTDALSQCGGRTVIVDGIAPLFGRTDDGTSPTKLFCTLLRQFQESVNFILIGRDEDVGHLLSLEPAMAGMFLYDIKLEPYSPEQLVEIARLIASGKGYTLSAEAAWQLEKRLETESRTSQFQNGKTLESIVDHAALRVAARVARMDIVSKGKLMRIEAEDLEERDEQGVEELLEELDGLTGLAPVKERVRRLAARARVEQAARRAGRKGAGFGTLHMIFTGNAGTGKTTVARIIGRIYRALGILPQGDKVVECGRSDLVGQYQGQTAPRVRAKVAEAAGGVLFIDEAYALCRDALDTFGREAVDTLVAEVENHRADLMVILAGYCEDMDHFLDQNQGLASRFPNRLEFADYTREEMERIFLGMLSANGRRLSDDCTEPFRDYIDSNRGRQGFGNARGIRNLCQRLIETQSVRLSGEMERDGALSLEAYEMITREDFEKLAANDGPRKKSLQDWLDELNGLTGLASVKEQVRRKSNAILAQKEMAERNLGTPGDFGTLHMVFRGSAGTGKTTVARILGGIYNALGLLPNGDVFVECGRSDLVGEYQGHTAMKVKQVVSRALGGVLFIDEAYALCRDAHDSFGHEAVDALIADMENHRGELMVILAGYCEDIDRFLDQNQGMASRIPTVLTFEDYTQDEMLRIFRGIVTERGFVLPPDAEELARRLIAERSRDKGFGNARGVRNLAEKLLEFHNARIGGMLSGGNLPGDREFVTITPGDFQEI